MFGQYVEGNVLLRDPLDRSLLHIRIVDVSCISKYCIGEGWPWEPV
jgi:hypothetical protein